MKGTRISMPAKIERAAVIFRFMPEFMEHRTVPRARQAINFKAFPFFSKCIICNVSTNPIAYMMAPANCSMFIIFSPLFMFYFLGQEPCHFP